MAKPRGLASDFGMSFTRGSYRYALAPWTWSASLSPHWQLPVSAIGGVDLRPLPAQAIQGGTPQGLAFCAALQSPGGTALATAPHMSEANATTAMQDAWEAEMGYRPQGAKLTDLLWDQLTTGSDPTGASGPKPLVPGTDGFLKLYVGGHSLVKRERFRWGTHQHTNRLRDLLRCDFERQWEESNGSDHCRRCLDCTCQKYRVDDWREFVPLRLHGHVPGRLPHETTITDNFNRANEALDAGPWDEVSGTWNVTSNQCVLTDGGGGVDNYARHDSALSSDDHYSQWDVVTAVSSSYCGPSGRFAAAANTHYSSLCRDTDNLSRIYKVVAGALTALTTDTFTFAFPIAVKLEVNGSSLTLTIGGSTASTVTDTAITGNTQAGVWASGNGGGNVTLDNFEAADLAAASAAKDLLRSNLLQSRLLKGLAA